MLVQLAVGLVEEKIGIQHDILAHLPHFGHTERKFVDTVVEVGTEQTPRKPATSPYGNTKQMCEDILRDSLAAYEGLKGIALRYFNPIGAHPSALIGELPRGVPQNLVPYITQTAAGIRECLSVFGDDYPTPDGSNIRDYIDVVDLAKAHVAAIRRMIEDRNKARYEVFNIGTGRGVSVLELGLTSRQRKEFEPLYKAYREALDKAVCAVRVTRASRGAAAQA